MRSTDLEFAQAWTHKLEALGVVQRHLRPLTLVVSPACSEPRRTIEPLVAKPRHGGMRQGAGRKKMYRTHAEKIRQYRKRKRSVSVYTKSSSQVANFIDVKQG